VICDDAGFTAANLQNFLWVTFTRSNPAQDVYGAGSYIRDKHWSCKGTLIIDARKKPHHAPELVPDPEISDKVSRMLSETRGLEMYA
jgi:4-hydroxy-3-polyprenylbenzoate decarboxylase